MASRFWVGGAGTWNAASTTHWAASSGGASGASAPTSGDDATFDTSSGLTAGLTVTIASGAVCNNWTITGPTAKNVSFSFSANFAPAGTVSLIANSQANRIYFLSSTAGTQRTLTIATLSALSDICFRDILGAGAASPFTGTRVGDCLGNSGITTTTPASQAFAGGTKNWSDSTVWTSRVPLPQDDVTASGVAGTLTTDMACLGANIDFTGFTGTLDFTPGAGTSTGDIFGNLKWGTGMSFSNNNLTIRPSGRSTHTINYNGKSCPAGVTIQSQFGGTYTLAANMTITGSSVFGLSASGYFDASTFNVTVPSFQMAAATATLKMGTGTWSLTRSGVTVWNVSAGSLDAGASTISLPTDTATRTFVGGGYTYYSLSYTVAGSTGALTITGSNTFSILRFKDASNARTLTLTAGTTQTISTTFDVNGTASKLMSIVSSSGGSPATISKPGGTVSCDYLSIQDSTATGGATWYAGANSTSVSGNTGWIFTAPPAPASSSTYGNAVFAAGPALYWRLNESTGTVASDSTNNGFDGVYTGTYTLNQSSLLASDTSDKSATFSSATAGGYVTSTYSNAWVAAQPFSIEAWAKWTGTGDSDSRGAPFASTNSGGPTRLYFGVVTIGSGSTRDVNFTLDRVAGNPDCTWTGATTRNGIHHYVVTFDGVTTVELFVDGASQGTKTLSTTINAATQTFRAGWDGIESYWQGQIDEVAVYTRVLTAAEIRSHFSIGSTAPISVQPTSPVPKPNFALGITLTDGSVLRFGPDEQSVSQIPLSVSFETEMPGGFGPADITVPRPNRFDRLDVNLFASGRIYDTRTNRTFHLGRITGISEPSEGQVEFQFEGWSKHPEDDNTAKQIFYDRDFSAWTGPSVARQINRITNGFSPVDASDVWDNTVSAPGPALSTEVTDPWGVGSLPTAEGWYYGNGVIIAYVDYAWKKSSTINSGDPNWAWYVRAMPDDTFVTFDDSLTLIGPGPSSSTLTCTSNNRKYVVVQLTYAAAVATTNNEYSIYWTLLGVVGNHGVTLQGTVAAPQQGRGLLASDVIAYVVGRWCPLLTYSSDSQGSIEPTSFVIPHLVYKDSTNARDMIDGLSVLGGNASYPMDWGVYDGADGKPEFFYKTPGNYGKTWRARRDQATESLDVGPDSSERLNGVYVNYNDGTGTTYSVGPTGSGADLESSLLVDTDPTNPANTDGAKHWHVYDAGITSQAGALLIGQLVIADANRQLWRGSIKLKGSVYDDSGNVYPVARVRAGDLVVVEDDVDTRPRRIVNTSYDSSSDETLCSVGAPPDRLSVLLARLGIVLSGRL